MAYGNLVSGILLEHRYKAGGKNPVTEKMEKMNDQQNVFTQPYKQAIKVALSKGLMMILNIFGWGTFFSGLYLAWINVDVFTRSVLQLLGCIFMLFKIVQAVDGWWHKRAMNKIEKRKFDLEQAIREEEYIKSHTRVR